MGAVDWEEGEKAEEGMKWVQAKHLGGLQMAHQAAAEGEAMGWGAEGAAVRDWVEEGLVRLVVAVGGTGLCSRGLWEEPATPRCARHTGCKL